MELWCIEVNDVFEANYENIKKVFLLYHSQRQKHMSSKNALDLMMKQTDLQFTPKEAMFCLGYSKMTVRDESFNFIEYVKVQFVELLEMIGRMAKIKFRNTVQEEEPLATKIELVLDMILPLANVTRVPVAIKDAEESESDEDY